MGNAASSLPYEIGDEVKLGGGGGGGGSFGSNNSPEELYGWKLHEGRYKSDGTSVSVFVAKKPLLGKTAMNAKQNTNFMQLEAGEHHFRYCKRLRHPYLLNVLATLDTDNPTDDGTGGTPKKDSKKPKQNKGDLIVVTEKCVTLQSWLNTGPSAEEIAWGLECIVKALHFLHNSAKLVHGNISPSSFFVTSGGDIKLWSFNLVSTASKDAPLSLHFQDYENLVTPISYRSKERIDKRYDLLNNAGIHATDSYGLGILIPYLYNDTLPTKLQKAVQRMQTTNIKMRPRLQSLLKCPVFDTQLQKLQLELEQLSVAPVEQKLAFWQNLGTQMNNKSKNPNYSSNNALSLINDGLAVYKVLPLIANSIRSICSNDSMLLQDFYRKEVLAVVVPLFYIAEHYLPPKLFEQKITPLVQLLFTVKDRAVRGALLGRITFLQQNLDSKELNSKVFEPLCSGFSDSSSALRELSLKASFVLVPQLSAPNLEKLSRYLIRLQSDPEPSIRTNSIIFIAKLAPDLSSDTVRHKLLLPAIVRAMKDPFYPCRLAALQSLSKTIKHFDPIGLASKVVPVIAPILLDPVSEVRIEAFKVLDIALIGLRQESDKMGIIEQQPGQPNHTGGIVTPSPSSGNGNIINNTSGNSAANIIPEAPKSGGSYLTGFSTWIASSTTPSGSNAVPAVVKSQPSTEHRTTTTQQPRITATQQQPPATTQQSIEHGVEGWGDNDGWDDDDDLNDDPISKVTNLISTASVAVGTKPSTMAFNTNSNTNNDPFAAFGMKSTQPSTTKYTQSLATTPTLKKGPNTAKSSSMMKTPTKKKKEAVVAKLNAAVDDGWGDDDGWDDF